MKKTFWGAWNEKGNPSDLRDWLWLIAWVIIIVGAIIIFGYLYRHIYFGNIA